MKKEEAIKEKQVLLEKLKEIQEIIDKPEITKEQRFLEILNGCEIKIDKEKYPDSVFFFKNGECYFEIQKSIIWCKYKYVWSIFETEFLMDYTDIQSFIKGQVEEHFKCKVLTPHRPIHLPILLVEKHFKRKVLTPKRLD